MLVTCLELLPLISNTFLSILIIFIQIYLQSNYCFALELLSNIQNGQNLYNPSLYSVFDLLRIDDVLCKHLYKIEHDVVLYL